MADTLVTPQTVIDNSIARAKDSNKTQWTDAQLLKFLNKAYDYVHRLLMVVQSEIAINEGTVTLVADTQEYTLPDDFWVMANNGVRLSGDPLGMVTYEDKVRCGADTTDEAVVGYYLTDDKVGVIPIPTATSVALGATLNLRFFKYQADLVLLGTMPYKNILNEPMATFMDQIALIKTDAPAQEVVTIYNSLEQATLAILQKRGVA
jgi:hypothetical protein